MVFLKWFFRIFSLSLVMILLCAATLWYNLDVLLTNENLKKAESQWFPEIKVPWASLNFKIENRGWVQKKLIVRGENDCIKYKSSQFCFDEILLEAVVKPLQLSQLFKMKKLKIHSKKINIQSSDFLDKSKSKKEYVSFQNQLNGFKASWSKATSYFPKNFSIQCDEVSVRHQGLVHEVGLTFSNKKIIVQWKSLEQNLSLNASFNEPLRKLESIQGDLEWSGNNLLIQSQWSFLTREKNIFSADIDLERKILKHNKELELDAKVRFQMGIDFQSRSTTVSIKNLNLKVLPNLKRVRIPKCQMSVENNEENNMELDCPEISVLLSAQMLKEDWGKGKKYLNDELHLLVKGAFSEKKLRGGADNTIGQTVIELKTHKNALFDLNGEGTVNILRKKSKMVFQPDSLSLLLNVGSFQKIIAEFSETPFAIPAPLNQMDGPIDIEIKDTNKVNKSIELAFSGQSQLKAKESSQLLFQFEGSYLFPLAGSTVTPHLEASLDIRKAYFYLPPIDPLRGLPQLGHDSRIVKMTKKTKKADKKITYKISIKALNRDSIRLYYKYFKPYLGFSGEWKLSSEGLKFKLQSKEPWSIEYLKRKLHSKKFEIYKEKVNAESIDLNIRFLYKASGYDIFINAIGSVEKPQVTLSSYPSLSREDIISVLLYNRTSKDLYPSENESVGGAESAMKDRAIGLLGIWAFASTPIESVSYDSKNQSYRAQIGLPGGVKFDVGTDWEKLQNLRLRKTVVGQWVLVTSYEPIEGSDGVGNIFLQKEWSY